jgi:hypothetical protein
MNRSPPPKPFEIYRQPFDIIQDRHFQTVAQRKMRLCIRVSARQIVLCIRVRHSKWYISISTLSIYLGNRNRKLKSYETREHYSLYQIWVCRTKY